jgi:hypothetical protein
MLYYIEILRAVARIKQTCGKASRQSTTLSRKMKAHLLYINKVLCRRAGDAREEVGKSPITWQRKHGRQWPGNLVRIILIPEAAYKLTPELEKIDRLLTG